MRKANAAAGLLAQVLLLLHLAVQAVLYWTMSYRPLLSRLTSYCFFAVTAVHALGSIALLVFRTDGALRDAYPRFNRRTTLQRVSALAVLLLLPLHTHTFGLLQRAAGKPGAVCAVLAAEILFDLCVLAHTTASFGRGLISLGRIETPEQLRAADRAAGIVTAVVLLASAAGVVRGQLLMTGVLGGGPG